MSKAEKKPKKVSKKEIRKLVYDKLEGALSEYKSVVKEKRFASNLKKASKLLAADIARASNKLNGSPEKKAKEPAVELKLSEAMQP
jgi:hypothetical protein